MVHSEEVHAAVTALVKAHALPETDVCLPGGNPQLEPWKSMLDRGFISHVRLPAPQPADGQPDGYQLSEDGRRALQVGMSMRTKAPVFKVREHLPLESCSPFELALSLRDRGFEWSPFSLTEGSSLAVGASH